MGRIGCGWAYLLVQWIPCSVEKGTKDPPDTQGPGQGPPSLRLMLIPEHLAPLCCSQTLLTSPFPALHGTHVHHTPSSALNFLALGCSRHLSLSIFSLHLGAQCLQSYQTCSPQDLGATRGSFVFSQAVLSSETLPDLHHLFQAPALPSFL